VQSLGRRLRARRVASRRVASSVVKVVTSSRRRVVASRASSRVARASGGRTAACVSSFCAARTTSGRAARGNPRERVAMDESRSAAPFVDARASSRARSIRARARDDGRRASRGMASTVERVGRARAPVRKTILTHPDDDADALALGCAVHGASRRV
jgi:hypothetical protein